MPEEQDYPTYDYGADIDADEARGILNKVARFCGTMVDIANRITETLDLRDVRRIATDDLPVVEGHADKEIWENAPSKRTENSETDSGKPAKRKRNHPLFAFFRMAQRAATTLNKVLPITTPELFPKRQRGGESAYGLPGLPGLPG